MLQAVTDRPLPAVIFVTAYDQYALQAFEVHALDYLLKPFTARRFQKALQRARQEVKTEAPNDSPVERRLLNAARRPRRRTPVHRSASSSSRPAASTS